MLIRHEIDIDCDTGDIFSWLRRFDRYYLLWHHDHIACNYINGSSLEVGAVLFCQEYIEGRPRKFRMTITGIDDGSRVDYTVSPGITGAYAVRPAGAGVRFTAELRVGLPLPLMGTVSDAILKRIYAGRFAALRRHMAAEGVNLKSMIEAEVRSHRHPRARASGPSAGYSAAARCETRSC